jgi:hypothetical protein
MGGDIRGQLAPRMEQDRLVDASAKRSSLAMELKIHESGCRFRHLPAPMRSKVNLTAAKRFPSKNHTSAI